MVFSKAEFLFLLLPLTLLVYWLPFFRGLRWRNVWLLLVSLFFYAWGERFYVLLMVLSIIGNWLLGLWVSNVPKPKGKAIVALACVFNLGLLFAFKYLNWILTGVGLEAISFFRLPIGISFYTFQALSYVIDVYRGKDPPQKNLIDVGLYIAFFPQLVAGPIVRYGTVAKQLRDRTANWDSVAQGAWRFTIGLSKKLILADQLGSITRLTFQQNTEQSALLAWLGALAVMLQIFFDFSGYSDMAIGLGKMFGFDFPENFNYPYISRSVSEFWRRWHISLSSWFRDYLYYPLSVGPSVRLRRAAAKRWSRQTAAKISTTFTMFVVWLATGLWHGANLTFVVWGLLQFVFLTVEQYRKPGKNKQLSAVLGTIGTILAELCSFVLFQADSLSHAVSYFATMLCLRGNALADPTAWYWLRQYGVVFLIGIVLSTPIIPTIRQKMESKGRGNLWAWIRTVGMILLLLLDIGFVFGGDYSPFIYFNF